MGIQLAISLNNISLVLGARVIFRNLYWEIQHDQKIGLISYKQAMQKIRDLSGGERSRLQLALLVLSGANFLLLDEPTNNLDIASAEVLENALADFDGKVLVISHDRYFLDRTVERTIELKDGSLTEYYGGYSDYAKKVSMV